MGTHEAAYFYRSEVTEFQVLLEESTRAKPVGPQSRFVEPDAESFGRLKSRFHHVLYGRRGTGKSSLLRKMEATLREEARLVAWTDQETYTAHSYPDVLVATLAEVFRQFSIQVKDISEKPKKKLFRKERLSESESLALVLDDAVAQLVNLKNSPSESAIEWTASYASSSSINFEGGSDVQVALRNIKARNSVKAEMGDRREDAGSIAHRYKAEKKEHIERAVSVYRDLIKLCTRLAPDAYIVLDDFYRLPENVQPDIAGYFHRVVKDTGVWLKFGSIPFWTRLYRGSPAVGLQAPHDIREISLDRGLPDFNNSKRFLEQILASLAEEMDVDPKKLFSDGALDRLVLAAGGVPRDYLGLASDSIGVAKNRGVSQKAGTGRVIAEDVNEAAGRTVNLKYDDLEEDAGDRSGDLRELIINLTSHCRKTKRSWFLVDTLRKDLVRKLGRLQNMRFVHLIDSNESLPDQKSSRYLVYMLDVSQLAAQRAVQVDFMGWQKRSQRRARNLVFEGSSVVEEVAGDSLGVAADQPALFSDEDAIFGKIDEANSTDLSAFKDGA
ncbi:hypothetical protein ABZ644_12760 [Nocardiopsis alba]|uniref:ORC-CDC6 family AAA ATPase n=1 Tax=Nocardiopsis alba TaxID=53437 RepID=UPI0033DB2EE3